jgi:hypothetical protein
MPTVEQTNHFLIDGVSSGSTTFTLNSYSNSLLLVCVNWNNDDNETVSDVTWNGVSLTRKDGIIQDDDAAVDIWYMTAPTTGNLTLEVTFSLTLKRMAEIGYMVISGVDQTTPLGAFASAAAASGAGTSIDIDVASANGDLVFAGVSLEAPGDAGFVSPGSGQTDHWNVNQTPADDGRLIAAGSTKAATTTTTNMSYTLPADDHRCMGGVAVKAAAAAAVKAGSLVNSTRLKSKVGGGLV